MGKKRDAILDVLEGLTPDEFKKFKLKLGAVPLREGYRSIPRGALGTMDAIDVTDKLVSFYCEAYAAEIAETVLREMGLQEPAQRLHDA